MQRAARLAISPPVMTGGNAAGRAMWALRKSSAKFREIVHKDGTGGGAGGQPMLAPREASALAFYVSGD